MLIPKWLRIQRAGLFLFSVSGVLLLVHALGYLSNAYIFYAFGDRALVDFYHEMQGINNGLLYRSLLAIVFAIVLYMIQLGKHAAGRFTLLITVLVCAASLAASADALIRIAGNRLTYTLLDLSVLDRYVELGSITYSKSTIVFDLGIAAYALFFAAALFVALTVARNAFVVRDIPVVEKQQ
ncbi:MAG: hypothetical protein FWB99_00535 [Treponema sp.]|nr:hypothetical protein [Treponema sp.]